MWKSHLIVCAVVLLLALPVYLVETALLKKGGGGGFIMLDLSGIFIVPYLIFAVLHVVISTMSMKFTNAASLWPLHIWSGVAAIACMVVGFFVYDNWNRMQDKRRYAERLADAAEKRKLISIKEWWFVPNAEHPQEVHVAIRFGRAGRFAGHVDGESGGEEYEKYFVSETVPQRMVEAGEELTQVFPLKVYKDGEAPEVSIRLSLYKKKQGPDVDDVILVYEKNPKMEIDGWTIYDILPPPVSR